MFYTIYKTTNLVNGKFYIGKHQTNNLNDGYVGSGKYLKRAIQKYGLDNFTTEILEIYDNEQQMNLAEKILVVCDSEVSYNLCPGGHGGFGYLNDGSNNHIERCRSGAYKTNQIEDLGKRISSAFRKKAIDNPIWRKDYSKKISESLKGKNTGKDNHFFGKTHNEDVLKKISVANKGKIPWNKGISMSKETREKISKTLLDKKGIK